MNYTGRPSISGCRPVLSLYPTHRFCQYLLLIFITFTNSFLFNRAFSTNSRRPSQSKALPLGELAGASPTERARLLTENHRRCDSIALTKSLPIAAPAALSRRACPLRHCFAMPPLPKGEALAGRKAQKIPHGGRNSLGDFSLPEMKALGSHISAFIVCHSPQKSSTAQKVYKPDRELLLDSTSPSRLTPCHLPYRGEALAVPAK